MRKRIFKKTNCSILAGLLLIVLIFSAAWILTGPLAFGENANQSTAPMDRLFKTMGIIKLAGIAPPVDIELHDYNGKLVKLLDFRGKIVLLNFWTTWCGDCREEMPALENLFNRLKDREFAMVAVNLRESPRQIKDFLKNQKLSFTSLLDTDGKIAIRFGIRSIPTTFIFDEKGALIGKALGPRDWDSRKSVHLFETLIGRRLPQSVE